MLGFGNYFGSNDFLSIDFSSSALKVAQATTSGSSLRVDFADRETIRELDDENRVEKYTEALHTILDRNSLSNGQRIIFSLPTSSVIVRHLELPAMSDDRLSDVIQYEAESHIPFPLEEVAMDYHVLEKTDEETRLVLVVSKEEKLQQYLDVLDNTNLRPEIIDISAFSLFNLYQYFNNSNGINGDQPPKVLVDVGHQNTDIIIFQNSTLYYARSASVAGESITEEISDRLNVGYERAEELKVERGHLPLTETEPDQEMETTSEPKPPPPSTEEEDGSDEGNPPPPPGETSDSDQGSAPPPPSPPEEETDDSQDDDDTLDLGVEYDEDTDDELSLGDADESTEGTSQETQPESVSDQDLPDDQQNGEDSPDDAPDLDAEDQTQTDQPPPPPTQESEDESEASSESLDLSLDDSSEKAGEEESSISPESADESDSEGESTESGTAGESLPETDRMDQQDSDDTDDTSEGELSLELEDGKESEAESVEDSGEETASSRTEESDSSEDDSEVESESFPDTEPDAEGAEPSQGDESRQTTPSTDTDESISDESDDDDELDLGLGELRSPDDNEGDNNDSSLNDPFADQNDEDTEEESEDDDDLSLGAAANPDSPPPEPSDLDSEKLEGAIVEQVDRLIGEIRQTFDYFQNEMDGDEVEEIILCGSGSKLRNLPEYLEQEMSRTANRYQPTDKLIGLAEDDIQSMMVASGLHLRTEASSPGISINLLPEEIIKERQLKKRRQKMVANGVLAGIFILQLVIWVFYSYQVRNSYFEKSKEQLKIVQPIVNRVEDLKETRKQLRERINIINELQKKQTRLLPLIHQLNKLEEPVRNRTWFRSISFNEGTPHGTLRVKGVTGDFQDVSNIYQWLDRMEFTLEQKSENQTRTSITIDDQSRSMVQFTVNYAVTFVPYNTEEMGLDT